MHGRIDDKGAINQWIAAQDLKLKFECKQRDYGVNVASRRTVDEQTNYWRVNQFVAPFWTFVPPQSKYPELFGHAWVPIDDEHALCLMFSYTPVGPLYPCVRQVLDQCHKGRETGQASVNCYEPKPLPTPYGDFYTRFTPENAFDFDYDSQQSNWFSGMPGLWVQDAACQAGVTPIYDRTQVNLCVSDTGVVMTRRMLLESILSYQEQGIRPPGAGSPDLFMVRAVSMHLPVDASWEAAAAEPMSARLGADFGYEC